MNLKENKWLGINMPTAVPPHLQRATVTISPHLRQNPIINATVQWGKGQAIQLFQQMVEQPLSKSRERVSLPHLGKRFFAISSLSNLFMARHEHDNPSPKHLGPTTPVKRGRGRNLKPHSDISVESPYFSPSKERPPGPKGEDFLSVERRLQSTTTKTDQIVTAYAKRRFDSRRDNASESDDPFGATQTWIPSPASPASVSGLYRQLALCKPYLIQGVLFLSKLLFYMSLSNPRMPLWRSLEGPCSCHIT